MDADRLWFERNLTDRFVRYARINTMSDRHGTGTPSTAGQWELAKLLVRELSDIGVENVYFDDNAYIVARIPSNLPEGRKIPTVGLMAHMDTAPDLSGENVEPKIHSDYDGEPIELNDKYVLSPEDYPQLLRYIGDTVITTDGTTLLGADDKAGVAEIMTVVAYLSEHPEIGHGPIEVIFTPDEETGHGMDRFPQSELSAEVCYTLDGDREGTIEAECFNAFKVVVTFDGYVIHPGQARGKLANAVVMAGQFLSMIPRSESPEATDERYGFYCPTEVSGGLAQATVEIIVRDFEINEVRRRIAFLESAADTVEKAFPGGSVTVEAHKQYLNMRDALQEIPEALEHLNQAVRDTGMEPELKLIRGGTDGARLTEMGIPTPNLFAGGMNFHGRYEWVAVPAMVRAAKTVINLVQRWASGGSVLPA
jgi:tripeptide aminopeptidase